MRSTLQARLTCLVLALPFAAAARAADGEWQQALTAYVVAASLDGQVGIRGVTADVDVPFREVLDNLDGGLMLNYRADRGRFGIQGDFIYLGQKQKKDATGPLGGVTRATVDADQYIFELDGSWALTDTYSVYGGLRYWDLKADVEVVGGGPLGETLAAKGDENWVDPVVGVRALWRAGDRWSIVARGDVGGFGIGSDFTWQLSAFAAWQWTEHATLLAGVRYLDVDYDNNKASGKVLWDVSEGGPAAGFTWRF